MTMAPGGEPAQRTDAESDQSPSGLDGLVRLRSGMFLVLALLGALAVLFAVDPWTVIAGGLVWGGAVILEAWVALQHRFRVRKTSAR
jgi:hypothetical protein